MNFRRVEHRGYPLGFDADLDSREWWYYCCFVYCYWCSCSVCVRMRVLGHWRLDMKQRVIDWQTKP